MFSSKLGSLGVTLGIVTLALLSGCGGQSYHDGLTTAAPGGNGGATVPGPGTSPAPVVDNGGGVDTGFAPAMTFSFSLTGKGGNAPIYTTPSFGTDNILRVRVTAGRADQLSLLPHSGYTYSNYTADYTCISYTVTVAGQSIATKPLAVDGGGPMCPSASDSVVLDFSRRLGPGHGSVQVVVSDAKYDHYCTLWAACQAQPWTTACNYSFPPQSYTMFCPLRTVYRTHTVTGSLDIQINGTTL